MNLSKNWYVVFTKPKFEIKVAHILTLKGIENYCPCTSTSHKGYMNERPAQEPLFASYVFVCVSQEQLFELKKINGIINILYWLKKPAEIKSEDIATIKYALKNYKKVQLLKTGFHERQYAANTIHNKISLPLYSLGFTLVAEQEKEKAKSLKPVAEEQSVKEAINYSIRRKAFNNFFQTIPSLFNGKAIGVSKLLSKPLEQ